MKACWPVCQHALIFRVPDRGSGNPTPLGGWDRGASKLEWLDGSVQAGQPYCLDTAKTILGPTPVGEGLTDEVWVEYIKNQTPPEPDENFNMT
jgi:hypothetical protein